MAAISARMDQSGSDEDRIMEAAIEGGATDVIVGEDESIEVICMPEEHEALHAAMTKNQLEPETSEITMRASTRAAVDVGTADTLLKMLDVLDDLDDVQQVYSNADFPEDLLSESA